MAFFSFPAQVNERAARVVAGTVATAVVVAIGTGFVWVLPVLAIGFLLRVGWGPRFSPLARFAMFAAKRLWEVRPVAGAPKRFAQGIGAACTVGATALFFAGFPGGARALAALVAVFATLEASIAFCMGCWVYARLQRAGVFPPDACVDCAPGLT
jgi:hypothetical protein